MALSKLSWTKSKTGFSSGLNCFLVRLSPDIVYQVSAIGISPLVQENDNLGKMLLTAGLPERSVGRGRSGVGCSLREF